MIVLLSTLWLFAIAAIKGQAISCCRNAGGFKTCKDRCMQLDAETDVSFRYQKLRELPKHCPGHLIRFWRCLNSSNPVINPYIGTNPSNFDRTCCLLPESVECRKACRQGKKRENLTKHCHEDAEASMFRCLDRYEASRNCCKNAHRNCITSCQVVFSSDQPPSRVVKKNVSMACSRHRHVISCVDNLTSGVKPCSVPQAERPKGFKCCKKLKSIDVKCKRTCRQDLQSQKSEFTVMQNLLEACGIPYASNNTARNEFWTCLVSNSNQKPAPACPTGTPAPAVPVSGVDSARLQCCSKAKDYDCRRRCIQMYTSKWAKTQNWESFDRKCGYNPREIDMMNCLADVKSPCRLGCSGLSYCTNFNNRHTELFRSCNIDADYEAKSQMEEWTKGSVYLPNSHSLCSPNKAVQYQVSTKHHLQECGNRSSHLATLSPEEVCNEFSPRDEHVPCISLQDYLVPSKYTDVTDEVTHPCNHNPCKRNQVCEINRSCLGAILDRCQSHTCVPDHGEMFMDDCNMCVCFAGELTCTKINCPSSVLPPDYNASRPKRNQTPGNKSVGLDVIRTLPCGCDDSYRPACASDGKTYPNLCVARCMGLSISQLREGNCASINPCKPNPCQADEKCIVERKTCLSITRGLSFEGNLINNRISDIWCPMIQFILPVSEGKYCSDRQLDPVCDTANQQHPNLCSLQFNSKSLAYRGFCKDECKPPLPSVCGVNGETYSSTCAANSARVIVDYQGRCKAVGVGEGNEPRCKNVTCPAIKPTHCKGIIPPGACCPHCAAQVRILYSLKQLLKNREGFGRHESVTLEEVIHLLRRHVSTTECDLFGYHSLDGDLVVLVMAVTGRPTKLQVETCNREAQKLEAFINTATPLFTSDIVLSGLKGARSDLPTLSAKPQKRVSDSHSSKANQVNNSLIVLLLPIVILPVMLRTGRS
ncbi:Reversion-inducing cysteine-rich protein with Kazal motifs [Acropora cervicornis]|uniref:Reversion-inducing cysteine-rich protein with Kazal motifs n=1 Tax=Acropora cervicornis TaxID=6130 RepID=A0AAD9QIR2_ACRCE|nr:Reversion-inducing cysteine-rich protein with Kazal motifs [Acropora cervicornis]